MNRVWATVMLLVFASLTVYSDTEQNPLVRTWTSRSGNAVEAEYAGLERDMVLLRAPDGAMLKIGVASLSSEDQRWIKEEEAKQNLPPGVRRPTEKNELPVFDGGEWRGHSAVYTAAHFDAVMDRQGVIRIYPKDDGTRTGEPI